MADINIQRKKSSPSPWLLILLVLLVLGIGVYFLFKAETAPATDAPVPANSGIPTAPDSTTGAETGPKPAGDAIGDIAGEQDALKASTTPEVLSTFAQSDASQSEYGREGLRLLTSTLVSLADRDDLRDASIAARRDDLTSATSRIDEAGSSLRPGYIASAALVQAMQQKAYPALEGEVNQLTIEAAVLSGRSATAEDQQQLRNYLTHAARIVTTLNQPPVR